VEEVEVEVEVVKIDQVYYLVFKDLERVD